MEGKKIKVFFNKLPDNNFNLKNYFPFFVLFKNFNVDVTKNPEEADIIFELTLVGGKSFITSKDKKVVIVSGENLFMPRTFFNWLERVVRVFVGNEKKYKVMDKLDSFIPSWIQQLSLSNYFPGYINFVKRINTDKNHYVIWCNGERNSDRIYNYPLFLADFHDKMKDLVKRPQKKETKNKKFCAFVVSSNSARERVHFFKELSKYKKIDSYGRVMNNMGKDHIGHWRNNPELFSNYKFVICYENCFVDDFVTEKITNVMLSGAIPIYRGPKSVKDYFNTSSFINYDDLKSEKEMIKKIIELDKDDKKYAEMQKEPWFKNNKMPKIAEEKEKELIKFYKQLIKNDSV